MIRMIQSSSAGHAKAYFSEALSKSDFFLNNQELPGQWQGKLAERLGLRGQTSKEDFFALCENKNPKLGSSLTAVTREDRRIGYDINFHCPKSVSILHVLTDDGEIVNAFTQSVTATMQLIEADSKTRVRKAGQNYDRTTGELAWGHFVHQTARPVEGYLPDPHLHSHCFVFNATWDDTEKEFKAGQFGDIKRDMPYYQAYFHKNLSDKLADLGYGICATKKSFEIDNVPQKVIDLFSKRTDEIGRIAKEQGITDAKELADLGSRTRGKKQKGLSMEELIAGWRAQIEALGEDGKSDGIVRFATDKELDETEPQACIDYAVAHCFERASVMRDRRLLETALRFSVGKEVTTSGIEVAFKEDKRILHVDEYGETLCTTKEVLAEEEKMIDLAKSGKGKLKPLYGQAPRLAGLDSKQERAAEHVLTTAHRVSIIRGVAGAGKSTLMKAIMPLIEAAGRPVTVVAPTTTASRGSDSFVNAETVAKLRDNKELQDKLYNGTLIVDEAGQLGTKDMSALLELTTQKNAQLILVGDTRQHASVNRGDALRVISKYAGIKAAEVDKIYRQTKKEYRSAVEHLAKGETAIGFTKLNDLGFIQEIAPLDMNKKLVDDYMAFMKEGKTALIISPTHAQGEAVTLDIRDRMKAENLLGKKEVDVLRLTDLNLTEAQRKDSRNYQEGYVVQFNQNVANIKRGSSWIITKIDRKNVYIMDSFGREKLLPLEHASRYNVFAETKISLSKGDAIRITKNGYDTSKKRMNNGDVLTVVSVTKDGKIKLQNAKGKLVYEVDKNLGHISYAYCTTSYSSQGKNVDAVLISQPASTFPATDAKQFYVSVSRGKESCVIYTDDKEQLLEYALRTGDRKAAVEIVKGRYKDRRQSYEDLNNLGKPKDKEHGPDI